MKMGLFFSMVVLTLVLILSGCAQKSPPSPAATTPATAKPTASQPVADVKVIRLKAVSFQPQNALSTKHFQVYISAVNERAKGKMVIDYLGGTEIVTRADAPLSAAKGVIDIVYTAFTFYGGIVPIGHAMQISQITAKEERARGAWDYVREIHAKSGLYWLGRGQASMNEDTYWNSTKKITGLKDLVGQRAGSGSVNSKPFVQAVGASYVQVQIEDTYTALERSIIDSYVTPPSGQVSSNAYTICKNFIDQPFYRGNISIFIGMNKWNELTPEMQGILTGVLIDDEDLLAKKWDEFHQQDRAKMIAAGDVPVKLSAEENSKFLELAYSSAREDVIKTYPETGPKLMELLKK